MSPPTVFVTSATGSQGNAVARQLRALGWTVRATVRDLSSSGAKQLSSIGVTVSQANWDDEAGLKAALAGCTKVFLNVLPAFPDLSTEAVWGQRLVRLARETPSVEQLVIATGVYVERLGVIEKDDPNGFMTAMLRHKKANEEAVKAAGFKSYTILRGGFFMQNFLLPKVAMQHPSLHRDGVLVTGLAPDSVLPMIDTEDIGRFAVEAFKDPDRFNGVEHNLVFQYVTPGEAMEAMGKVAGRKLTVKYLNEEELEEASKTDMMLKPQLVVRDSGRWVDVEPIKKWGIPLTTFEEFLEREKDAVKQALP
jgi:uncharacterized protein YbjT (DUF2867 family)